MTALRSLLVLLLYTVNSAFGEHLLVILGDPVTFPKCAKEEASLVYQDITRLVADLQQGAWKPSDYYKNRIISLNSSVVFTRTVYTDTGSYELICGGSENNIIIIQLDVVLALETSVTERKTAKLKCHYEGNYVESIWWERDGQLVFRLNCASGEISYGTGFKERASVSSDGCKQGDFSLTLEEVQPEDGGDYFCYVQSNSQKKRGNPAAVRLTTNPEQTSHICPPLNTSQSLTGEKQMGTWTIFGITAAVTFVICAVSFAGLWWVLKSCCSSNTPGPRDGRDSAGGPLNRQHAPLVQVNAFPAVNGSQSEDMQIKV